MGTANLLRVFVGFFTLSLLVSCGKETTNQPTAAETGKVDQTVAAELSDEQIKNIVRHSYQYVAMFNVNNKFAMDPDLPGNTGGWNKILVNTQLLDHNVKAIARPNNDTLYINAMLDLREEPVILDIPAFDSKYVSLMVTGYDHYVNVPLSVTKGDFRKPEKVLFYTARTKNFDGNPIEGIDRNFEMTGDFVSAVFRVMPHANDKALFEKIIGQMQSVRLLTLSEHMGAPLEATTDMQFPEFGTSDLDVFENNFLEVMQFVVNHTTFDQEVELDRDVLATLKPLGIEPGKKYDRKQVKSIDGKRFRQVAEQVQVTEFERGMDPAVTQEHGMGLFKTKGQIPKHLLVLQSVMGPIGLPATEAMYPPVTSADGEPMNAQYDYVIRMSKDDLPPAKAFWSMTLYDSANGFFIPNDRKKYSVGENAGVKLNEKGGLDVYISENQPEGVPDENWLPINRNDERLDVILRIYAPDLEKMTTYVVPKAERL